MKTLRLIGLALGGLIVLVLVLGASLLIAGWNTMHASESNPLVPLRVTPDASLLARGEHLGMADCAGCHGGSDGGAAGGALRGSSFDFFAEPGTPAFGRIYAPNLTPGGRLQKYSDAELARAIREGVDRDGHPLLVMPSAHLRGLSDRDLSAIIAWLRRQPAVEHVVPSRQLTPLAYLYLGLHLIETSHQLPVVAPIADVHEGMSAAYGGYLAPVLGCADCHGIDMRGGRKGQFAPAGGDLVTLASAHDLEAFTQAVRGGVSATDGHKLDANRMPFPSYARLTDTEVAAIYTYLQSLAKTGH